MAKGLGDPAAPTPSARLIWCRPAMSAHSTAAPDSAPSRPTGVGLTGISGSLPRKCCTAWAQRRPQLARLDAVGKLAIRILVEIHILAPYLET